MKRLAIFTILVVGSLLRADAQVTVIPGPGSDWGNWTPLTCHSVIEGRVKVDSIHVATGEPNNNGKYMIWYQFRNADTTKTVSFSFSFGSDGEENTQRILGDSVKDYYRITLAPGASNSPSWNNFRTDRGIVMDVGYFRTEGKGSTDYEGCDGAANAVDNFCRLKPVAACPGLKKIQEERAKLASETEGGATIQNASYGSGPTNAEIPCEDTVNKDAAAADDIRQKIIQNLRDNIQPISLEQPRGEQYTILSPSINASGDTITIRFTERWDSKDGFVVKEGEEISCWRQDLVQQLSFAALASTLKERPIGVMERNAPYLSKTNVRWLAIDAAKDSQNYEAYKLNLVPGPPRGPVYGLPFDMGGANANYKELGKLLAQLKAMPRPNPGRVTVPCKDEKKAVGPEVAKKDASGREVLNDTATKQPEPIEPSIAGTWTGDNGIIGNIGLKEGGFDWTSQGREGFPAFFKEISTDAYRFDDGNNFCIVKVISETKLDYSCNGTHYAFFTRRIEKKALGPEPNTSRPTVPASSSVGGVWAGDNGITGTIVLKEGGFNWTNQGGEAFPAFFRKISADSYRFDDRNNFCLVKFLSETRLDYSCNGAHVAFFTRRQ